MRSRFTEEQIIGDSEGGEGRPVKEVIREHGISQDTFYRWRRKFGDLEVSDAKRLKERRRTGSSSVWWPTLHWTTRA